MENQNICQFNDENWHEPDHNPNYQIIEDSPIKDGNVIIPLKQFINLLRDNSWDFPSVCLELGIHLPEEDDEITMHPGYREMNFLNSLIPDGQEKLVEEDFTFDT